MFFSQQLYRRLIFECLSCFKVLGLRRFKYYYDFAQQHRHIGPQSAFMRVIATMAIVGMTVSRFRHTWAAGFHAISRPKFSAHRLLTY